MRNQLKVALGIFIVLVAVYLYFGIQNITKFKDYGTLGDLLAGIVGPMINVIGLYYIINTFNEQQNVTNLQKNIQKDEKKIHDYKVLSGLLESLKLDYNAIKFELFELISYLNNAEVSRISKIQQIRRNAKCMNYITHYGNLGMDIVNADLSAVDYKHLIIEYRNFGEFNLTRLFKALKEIDIQNEEITGLNGAILANTWALVMTKLNQKLTDLLHETLKAEVSFILNYDVNIVNAYYQDKKVDKT